MRQSDITTHGLRAYWRGCRCQTCKDGNAAYWRRYNFSRRTNFYVPAKRARQLLLSFESHRDAARATKVSFGAVRLIRNGETKKIRVQTEIKILTAFNGPVVKGDRGDRKVEKVA